MALIESRMMPLGTQAPAFSLPNPADGKDYCLEHLRGSRGTLVMFICNHCPYVKHMESALIAMGEQYHGADINIVAISANDAETHPQDGPEAMAGKGYPFPYLYDESQQVAKAYGAECTPDFFLFDADLQCVYRGQFDSSRPGNNIPVSGEDLLSAMDALQNGGVVSEIQKPSIGCNIKWKG
ncbi:MAG: thioredoxin family protein [Motiliproteus sp.]|nr:thioredoxin family protein [Motiliproteus sp.]MCW9052109.1 thioredoxin family protein [Motiliproteus sp.]